MQRKLHDEDWNKNVHRSTRFLSAVNSASFISSPGVLSSAENHYVSIEHQNLWISTVAESTLSTVHIVLRRTTQFSWMLYPSPRIYTTASLKAVRFAHLWDCHAHQRLAEFANDCPLATIQIWCMFCFVALCNNSYPRQQEYRQLWYKCLLVEIKLMAWCRIAV